MSEATHKKCEVLTDTGALINSMQRNNVNTYRITNQTSLAQLVAARDYHEHRGLEESTHKNYDTICRNYTALCDSANIQPWPVSYDSISLFFVHYCVTLGHSVTSTYNLSTALKNFTTINGYPWLNVQATARIKRLRRGLGKFQRPSPSRKCPMTLHRILEILTVTPLHDLQDLQYITIAWLAHDALLRFSEIRNLKHNNIKWTSPSTATITLEITKTSHDAPKEQIHLEAYTTLDEPISGTHLLKKYIQRLQAASMLTDGDTWLFPNLSTKARTTQLNKSHFLKWLRDKMLILGHDPSRFSGHSFRAGGATDLYASGASPRTIQLTGRWRSEAYIIYIRDHPEAIAKDVSKAFQAVIMFGKDIGNT